MSLGIRLGLEFRVSVLSIDESQMFLETHVLCIIVLLMYHLALGTPYGPSKSMHTYMDLNASKGFQRLLQIHLPKSLHVCYIELFFVLLGYAPEF